MNILALTFTSSPPTHRQASKQASKQGQSWKRKRRRRRNSSSSSSSSLDPCHTEKYVNKNIFIPRGRESLIASWTHHIAGRSLRKTSPHNIQRRRGRAAVTQPGPRIYLLVLCEGTPAPLPLLVHCLASPSPRRPPTPPPSTPRHTSPHKFSELKKKCIGC